MTSSPSPRPSRRNMRFMVPTALAVEIGRPDLLSAGGHAAKVTVLSAPSGYGKSTVLAQWARQTAAPVWIRLNQEAKDARALLYDLAQGAALSGVPLVNWEHYRLLEASRDQLLGALVEDLNDHEADLTFFLDGGEHLSAEAALLLSFFASLLGEGHQLLLAQREGSAFDVAPFVARGEGLVITADDLAFTPQHTAAAAERLGHAVPAEVLLTTYQGWPWGIMLALHTQQAGTGKPATELAKGVVSALPEPIGRLLPALSVLEFWSTEGATSMGVTLPDGWIESLQRAGLPMSSVGHGRFVPHDVVRDLLTEQLRQVPAQWKDMHARAAQHAETQGELYSAIRHHVEAGQMDRAVHLAEQLSAQWYRAADWRLAEEALSLIPRAQLSPELRSIHALAVLETGDLRRGRELLEAQLDAEPTATVHFGMAVVGLRINDQLLLRHHLDAGLAIATQQRDIIQLLRLKGVYHQIAVEVEEGHQAADEAMERAAGFGDPGLRMATVTVKAWLLHQQGHHDVALREYERTYQAGLQLGLMNRLLEVVGQLTQLYSHTGRLPEAARMLESYLLACERTYPQGTPTIQKSLGRTYCCLGRVEEGRALIWQAYTEFLNRGQFTTVFETLYSVFFAAMTGPERSRALQALDHVKGLIGDDMQKIGNATWVMLQEMYAFAAFTGGDTAQTQVYLQRIDDHTQPRLTGKFGWAALLRSGVRRHLGEHTPADAQRLRQCLDNEPEIMIEFRLAPDMVVPLMTTYVQQGWEAEFFRGLLQDLTATPDRAGFTVHLHLQIFGTVTATLGERAIKLGHSSALEALTYRALHPEARQDEVADQVWGHGDLKRARQSAQVARNTINAAFREAVQQHAPMTGDLLVTAGQGRKNPQWQINASVNLTTDVQAFLNSRSPEDMLRLHPQSFLAGSDSDWVMHYRDVLTAHAVDVLEDAARTACPDSALKYLVRAADLTQRPEGYERVLQVARQRGLEDLRQAAQQALLDLERGEVTTLAERVTLN